jgi:hypothetical protein
MEANSRVHRAWFFAAIFLFVTLIVITLVATYMVVDSSVTKGYFGATIRLQQEQLEILSRLMPELHRGRSHADILALLRDLYPDGFIAEGDEFVAFNNIEFRFDEEGQLALVEIR